MYQHLAPQNRTVNEGPGRIDSVQNGVLLNSLLHRLWDSWLLSINPVLPVMLMIDNQWNYRVTYFLNDGLTQPQFDGRIIQFNATPDLPAPSRRFLYEHFKQAVLANMKGAGQPRDLDFDSTEDAQTMSVFETGFGKEWLETKLADRLAPYEGGVVTLSNSHSA